MYIHKAKCCENFLILAVRRGHAYFIGSRAVGTCIQVSFSSTITRLRRDLVGIHPPPPSPVTCYFSYFNFPAISLSVTTCVPFTMHHGPEVRGAVYINRAQFVTICLLCIDDSDKLLHKCKREARRNQIKDATPKI